GQLLGLKISIQVPLPPPCIRRRRLPGVYPLVEAKIDSPRNTESCSRFAGAEEHAEEDRHQRDCINELDLLAHGYDVEHHVYAKEHEHLAEIRESEEWQHRHRRN